MRSYIQHTAWPLVKFDARASPSRLKKDNNSNNQHFTEAFDEVSQPVHNVSCQAPKPSDDALIQFSLTSARVQAWSSLRAAGHCARDQVCRVPAGQTWLLDESMDIASLTVQGVLRWDTSKDGLVLRAGFVAVEEGGTLEVGTVASPMLRRATIYITKGTPPHPILGRRFLGGLGSAKLSIHGRPLQRTWTQHSNPDHVMVLAFVTWPGLFM